jgi:hypothetical protein
VGSDKSGYDRKRIVHTRVETIRAWPATLLCLPAVITSHCWPAEPSQATTWTGVKLLRKSPEPLKVTASENETLADDLPLT